MVALRAASRRRKHKHLLTYDTAEEDQAKERKRGESNVEWDIMCDISHI